MKLNMMIMILCCCFAIVLAVAAYVFAGGGLFTSKGVRKPLKGPEVTHNQYSSVDYDFYSMTGKEMLMCIMGAAIAIFGVAYVFYRSMTISLLLTPLALLYPKIRIREIIRERKTELNLQFREMLYSIASSLSAGKSIELAFGEAGKELLIQYSDPDTLILVELKQITRRIEMNDTVEEALNDLAIRSHLEDMVNFADVFSICKRSGGNLVQVVKNSAEIISEKIDVRQEIEVLLTEKRLEYKVLNIMPVFIVLLLSTGAEEFMAPVFTDPLGRVAVTFSLLLFAAAYFVSKRIMDIGV
ncbi:MAG: type II secretion system F family protein [Pseudomonadota bacterium]